MDGEGKKRAFFQRKTGHISETMKNMVKVTIIFLHLLNSKCMPVLLYSLEVCPLNKAGIMWIVPRTARPLDAESLLLSTAVRIASSSITICRYGTFGKVFPIFPPKGQVSLPEHWCGVITHFLPFLTTLVPRLAPTC